jgi:hypothetical protein
MGIFVATVIAVPNSCLAFPNNMPPGSWTLVTSQCLLALPIVDWNSADSQADPYPYGIL